MPIFAMNKELRKEIYIMTTMELKTKVASHQSTSPCQYTTQELEERLTASIKSYHQGKYCTSEELRKRHTNSQD